MSVGRDRRVLQSRASDFRCSRLLPIPMGMEFSDEGLSWQDHLRILWTALGGHLEGRARREEASWQLVRVAASSYVPARRNDSGTQVLGGRADNPRKGGSSV